MELFLELPGLKVVHIFTKEFKIVTTPTQPPDRQTDGVKER